MPFPAYPNGVPSINDTTARMIKDKLQLVLSEAGADLNLTLRISDFKFSSEDKFTMRVSGSVVGYNYTDMDRHAENEALGSWILSCHRFKFNKEDRGRVVKHKNGKEYVLHSFRKNCGSAKIKVRSLQWNGSFGGGRGAGGASAYSTGTLHVY
jgi:hypothetical protein